MLNFRRAAEKRWLKKNPFLLTGPVTSGAGCEQPQRNLYATALRFLPAIHKHHDGWAKVTLWRAIKTLPPRRADEVRSLFTNERNERKRDFFEQKWGW